jgi:hypothetical protein
MAEGFTQQFELFLASFLPDQEDIEESGCHRQHQGQDACQPIQQKQETMEMGAKKGLAGDDEQEGDAQEQQADEPPALASLLWHGSR